MSAARGLCICCQPLGSGDELTQLAAQAGFATFEFPLVELRADEGGLSELASYLSEKNPEKFGVIFSSKMAARIAAGLLLHRECEIYAVGAKTAKVLHEGGVNVALIGESDLASLYSQIIERGSERFELLHICGELSVELPGVKRFVVYRTENFDSPNIAGLKRAVFEQLPETTFWLFTNPRTALRLKELVEAGMITAPRGAGVSIGASTSGAVANLNLDRYLEAKNPNFSAMIEAIR